MEGATATPSALPYVSWSSVSIAVIPADDWPDVFGYMQALKGHVQEYPGCQKLEAFVEVVGPEAVAAPDYRLIVGTTWDTPEQLEAFLERGYTFERMMHDVRAGIVVDGPRVMEKIF